MRSIPVVDKVLIEYKAPESTVEARRRHLEQNRRIVMASGESTSSLLVSRASGGGGFSQTISGSQEDAEFALEDLAGRVDDLAATLFAQLGIDPHTEVRDTLNRPLPIAQGSPISGLLA